jgi:NAD(P)-dependent dehydrogenase (short-subunit alcohol dehydrogenase family)
MAGDVSYRKLFDLRGKIALVTGACGLLGRRFVAGLAEFGADLALVDLDPAACERLADDMGKRYAVRTLGVACDVADPLAVRRMADAVAVRLGDVDILMNNAASKGRSLDAFFAPVESFDLATWREVMAVNLDGMFLVAQAIGKAMAARGGGSIIQTASIYGLVAPDQRIYEGSEYNGRAINTPAVYSAAKAGVIGLTRHLATYWSSAGVRVNTLTPGGVASGQNDEFSRRYSARVPLGRMAEADDLVGAVVFLASDASRYITGQNIVVDGGLSAW